MKPITITFLASMLFGSAAYAINNEPVVAAMRDIRKICASLASEGPRETMHELLVNLANRGSPGNMLRTLKVASALDPQRSNGGPPDLTILPIGAMLSVAIGSGHVSADEAFRISTPLILAELRIRLQRENIEALLVRDGLLPAGSQGLLSGNLEISLRELSPAHKTALMFRALRGSITEDSLIEKIESQKISSAFRERARKFLGDLKTEFGADEKIHFEIGRIQESVNVAEGTPHRRRTAR